MESGNDTQEIPQETDEDRCAGSVRPWLDSEPGKPETIRPGDPKRQISRPRWASWGYSRVGQVEWLIWKIGEAGSRL